MFRRQVKDISGLLNSFLRNNGLEGQLLQMRTIAAWDEVVGPTIASYTQEKFIKNQTLFIKMTSPALRQDLSMMRTQLLTRIKDVVGSEVVTDIKLY